ncbi:MAG: hypothetical protein L6R41_004923 [Letrouitia leprolyta]|nr:MAG: hypothetical protein L6R41_004923 [Letrouitia leprolyta]
MTAIRKVIISAYGDESNIKLVNDTLPPPPANQVQCKIIYSGFGGSDVNMRLGKYPFQKSPPLTPGYSFVARVTTNGPSSSKLKPGDLVACLSVYDGESTYVNMPEKYLVPLPPGLDLAKAVALILDWNTAYGMVYHSAKVSSGQRVFIHGCSGAVGYGLLALCKLQGAEVHGTCSEKNSERIRALGATPYTYRNKDWIPTMQKLGGADAVFDALSFESWDESYSILSPKGKLIGYGGNLRNLTGKPGEGSVIMPTLKLFSRNLNFFCGKSTTFYYIDRNQKTFEPDLKALFTLLGEGKIDVLIKKVFELEDVREAHRQFNHIEGLGSFAIRVDSDE